MPKLVRVKSCFVFSDIKTFMRSTDQFISEVRRFNLNVEDTDDESSNALYEQLVEKTIAIVRSFSATRRCQPFRLYWKDKEGHYIGFYSSSELLDAIDHMIPAEAATVIPTYPGEIFGILKYQSEYLMILVCIPDMVVTETTNKLGHVTQAPPLRMNPFIHQGALLPTCNATTTAKSATIAATLGKVAKQILRTTMSLLTCTSSEVDKKAATKATLAVAV